ncbi:MAG: hypothetical protein JWM86_1522 [Thermoleophilia bacterium]|nr:hypothetical protein [Thermoleophilia bacterium]
MSIPTWGKVAIGVGLAGGAALLLSACGREEDPQSTTLDKFKGFDKNQDNNWTQDEVTKFEVTRPTNGPRFNEYRVGDYVFYQQNIQHQEITSSMQKAFAGARGNDAIASLAELTSLATKFDKDANGTLSGGERRAFDDAYGLDIQRRTIIDNTISGSYHSPRDTYPDNGGYGGGTSPGDDYGNGGSSGSGNGGTSPGDDGGTRPPSGGGNSGGGNTSPGDDGGTRPPSGGGTRPPSGGGSTPPSGGGNSTDNGNPGEDDF